MRFLLLQNLRHIVRTKLLLAMLVFSAIIQFVGIKALHSATIYWQGVVKNISVSETLYIALLFQLFTGVFLAAVYGIWMIPYAHQGLRSLLTFTLPISKWKFPLAYGLSMLGLLLLQNLVLITSFGVNFGFSIYADSTFPWGGLLIALALETIAFEVIAFGFAVSSMAVGPIPTLFLGGITFFLLQVGGTLFRYNVGQFLAERSQAFNWFQLVYEKLPPAGELVFDLRKSFIRSAWDGTHLFLWAIWLAVFVLLFRYRIRYPSPVRGGES